MEHLAPQTPPIHQNAAKKGLRRQVLHPVRNPADAFSHLPEIGKGKPPGQTRYILPVRCRFPLNSKNPVLCRIAGSRTALSIPLSPCGTGTTGFPLLAAHGGSSAATRRSQALRVAARAFEVILFDGAGSHRARAWAACCFTAPHRRKNLNTGYEQGNVLLFSNVRKREQKPPHNVRD